MTDTGGWGMDAPNTLLEMSMTATDIRKKYNIPAGCPVHTPWGIADHGRQLAPGVWMVGTPSHGGVKVSHDVNRRIPDGFRRADGWYEEDCQWAIVALFIPEAYPAEVLLAALETVKGCYWREYERHFGLTLDPAESHSKRAYLFAEAHRDDWVAIAAYGDWHDKVPAGMVGCIASKGGQRVPFQVERSFLVPAAEYAAREPEGFVIDPQRHAAWVGV